MSVIIYISPRRCGGRIVSPIQFSKEEHNRAVTASIGAVR